MIEQPAADREKLKNIAFEALGRRRSHESREIGYLYDHSLRVAGLCEELSREISDRGIDDALYAAALFHDLGKGFTNHNKMGAHIARALLASIFGNEQIDLIASYIVAHCLRKSNEKPSTEIAILQDADMLDHFGAQGVWLDIQRAARSDESIEKMVEFRRKNETRNVIARCRALLNFEESISLFDERISFMEAFIDRLVSESFIDG